MTPARILLLLVVLAGCDDLNQMLGSEEDTKARAAFVGTWAGSYDDDDDTIHFCADHEATGKYRVKFQTWRRDGRIETSTESGKWFITGGVFKIHKEVVDGVQIPANNLDFMHPFKIESFSGKHIEYSVMGSAKMRFKATRIAGMEQCPNSETQPLGKKPPTAMPAVNHLRAATLQEIMPNRWLA